MPRSNSLLLATTALIPVLILAQPGGGGGKKLPANLFIVKPLSGNPNPATPAQLPISRGTFFSYALPQNWRVGEDGQFALTLLAPDNQAFTVMVGNAGLPPNYPPNRFVYEKMTAMKPRNLQLGPPRQAKPLPGGAFQQAFEFDVSYISPVNRPCRGVAKCSIAAAYDTALFVMTGAFSTEQQWSGYSSWLPLIAEQISATNGAAFGRRGIMAQNLQLSREYGEAARAYREWSQRNWQQVSDQRNASQDRRNYDVRENLGNSKGYVNPYNSSVPVDLPNTYKYYWVNRDGTYAGTNDPSVNPNHGSTGDWRPMPLHKP